MANYLVTGGAGFIGSHMAERLLAGGHGVLVLDNESTGARANVPAAAVYQRGDVAVAADVKRAFAYGLDGVFHIAGQASTIRSFQNPTHDLDTNTRGTLNVLEACLEYRVPRLLFASSMTVYGHAAQVPTPEAEHCQPISYYGITKYAAERYVLATAARGDLDFQFNATAFRMFNVYGERQSLSNPYQGVVAIFIANLLRGEPMTIHGEGLQSRDFVFIDDVVEAWQLALDNPAAFGQVFNLGSGESISINQLVDSVLAAFGRSRADYDVRYAGRRPGDQEKMQAAIEKVRACLGWQPRVGFDQGMRRTVAWAAAQALGAREAQ